MGLVHCGICASDQILAATLKTINSKTFSCMKYKYWQNSYSIWFYMDIIHGKSVWVQMMDRHNIGVLARQLIIHFFEVYMCHLSHIHHHAKSEQEQSETATYARLPTVENFIRTPLMLISCTKVEASTLKNAFRDHQNVEICHWVIMHIFNELRCWFKIISKVFS